MGGRCLVHFDQPLPLWARAAYAVANRIARAFRVTGGCFLFCTRRAYEATGGFCERYYAAEDVVFVRALKEHGIQESPGGWRRGGKSWLPHEPGIHGVVTGFPFSVTTWPLPFA